ncbi:unnamed protein product [Cylicostephanus goldi]|uniref:Transcription initiation factor TFIID subunit 13 n=1 Tax=Cylicostephanus goldi TaxID=71465 RepID=A0A3P6SLL1_CYLGO|nr:unnamed protein product [Cylicostephanus goldi]
MSVFLKFSFFSVFCVSVSSLLSSIYSSNLTERSAHIKYPVCFFEFEMLNYLSPVMDEDDDLFGSDLDDDDKRDKGSPEDKKFFFRKELRSMLYGFGDDKVSYLFQFFSFPINSIVVQVPYDKTLETLEGIVLDYIKELCERAMNVSKLQIRSRFIFAYSFHFFSISCVAVC